MSKMVQESNLKEGSAVATPKLVNVNLSSMRKIPSQGVSPARSWKQSAGATDDDPTMYSQERQQNDAQTSNTRRNRSEEMNQLNHQLERVCAMERSIPAEGGS